MAMLDFSPVVLHPMLASVFSVARRTETVNDKGRPTTTSTQFPNLYGVVTVEKGSKLERREDGQFVPRKLQVVTKFQLRSAAQGFQPDQVMFRGTVYTVVDVQPYPHFGQGFCVAQCDSMNAMDAPV